MATIESSRWVTRREIQHPYCSLTFPQTKVKIPTLKANKAEPFFSLLFLTSPAYEDSTPPLLPFILIPQFFSSLFKKCWNHPAQVHIYNVLVAKEHYSQNLCIAQDFKTFNSQVPTPPCGPPLIYNENSHSHYSLFLLQDYFHYLIAIICVSLLPLSH